MKKILLFLLGLVSINDKYLAQSNGLANSSLKNYRFGLRIAGQPSWLRSNDEKRVEPSGAVFGWGFGLTMDCKLTEVASISTGIGGDFEGGKQNFNDTVFYCTNVDDEIVKFETVDSLSSKDFSTFMLLSRKLKTSAVTIPITLKLSTKEIQGMRYFGQFGLNISYFTKMRSTDEVKIVYNKGVDNGFRTETISDVNPYVGVIPIRLGLNAGAGVEYRLSGSTSAYASVNYLHQFINNFVEKTNHYANLKSGTPPKLSDQAKMSAYGTCIQINVGVLF